MYALNTDVSSALQTCDLRLKFNDTPVALTKGLSHIGCVETLRNVLRTIGIPRGDMKEDSLLAGRLQRVLADHEPPPLPIHVLHREGRQASAKVRSFVDLLVERLRADAALS